MNRHGLAVLPLTVCCLAGPALLSAENEEFEALQSHFERVVNARFDGLFEGVENLDQWTSRRTEIRQNLVKMLWHEREWPAEPPPVTRTGVEEHPDYILENLILETAPQIYATANLYLPRTGAKPFPVILYQCGHANKNKYKLHGAWFAARGIALLMMDNIEMGEIEFTHHGVYSRSWFHWYSRGFSPLAVELLNARRALDYLATREDLDRERMGATGISGGGMTTFFLAAIDDRIKASAPVSGAFSTRTWVKRHLSFAHCDCQYPVNTYGLLYSEIGALTAPRPQLLCNSDADPGFPMDGFHELEEKMGEIYRLYGAGDALRSAVAPGGHSDKEAIRLPVYSFFLKEFLGIDKTFTTEGPVDLPDDESLVCFRDGYPLEERLTRIDEELLPAHPWTLKATSARRIKELTAQLRNEVFRHFPQTQGAFAPEWGEPEAFQGRDVRRVSFHSFEDLRVRGVYSVPANRTSKLPAVLVVDHRRGIPVWGNEQRWEGKRWGRRAVLIVETLNVGSRALEDNLRSFKDDDAVHHLKREAMVAGTTLESMQVYEVLRSLAFLRSQPEVDPAAISIVGKEEAGVNGLYAALLDGNVHRVVLESPPSSHRQGPTYLGVLRYTDIPEVIALMSDKVRVYGETPPPLKLPLSREGLDKGLLVETLEAGLR